MASRLGARILTGPLAFLLGGVIDVLTLAWAMRRDRRHPDLAGPAPVRPPRGSDS